MNKFQADAVAFGATPTTEHGARIGGPGVSVDGHSYVADTVNERKNDPVIRRLLQTLAAANVQEPEFSAIKEILERGLPEWGADIDASGRSIVKILHLCKECNTPWISCLYVDRPCSPCYQKAWDVRDAEREAQRLARRTWFELIWDRLFNHVE